MDRFACRGALRITTHQNEPTRIRVVMSHEKEHVDYCDIGLPDEIKQLIEKRRDSPPREVRDATYWSNENKIRRS